LRRDSRGSWALYEIVSGKLGALRRGSVGDQSSGWDAGAGPRLREREADLLDPQRMTRSPRPCNVAHLPGIVGASLAMPDMHEGYGFPIGGVAAFDAPLESSRLGVSAMTSTVRFASFAPDVQAAELHDHLARLVQQVHETSGPALEARSHRDLSEHQLDEVLTEARPGRFTTASAKTRTSTSPRPTAVFRRRPRRAQPPGSRARRPAAWARWARATTSAEVQVVTRSSTAEVATASARARHSHRAAALGFPRPRLPGVRRLPRHDADASRRHHIRAAPTPSSSRADHLARGRRYLAAMRAAANFAWANRQVMQTPHRTRHGADLGR